MGVKAKAPCKGCTDREVGCHAGCERYREFRAEIDARPRPRHDAADFLRENVAKTKKKLHMHKRK